MIDFKAFRSWQQAGNRYVKIEFGDVRDKNAVGVFVYDYDLRVGQFARTVEEIDLEERRKEQLEEVLKSLQEISKSEPLVYDPETDSKLGGFE